MDKPVSEGTLGRPVHQYSNHEATGLHPEAGKAKDKDFFSTILLLVMLLTGVSPLVAGDETAFYSGEISQENNQRFFKHLNSRKIHHLIITSPGGEVEAGIQLGRWVYDNRIDVEVREYCLSSCANYVFPAGKRKQINAGAIVAWHGNYIHLQETGLWMDDVQSRMRTTGEDEKIARAHVARAVARLVQMEKTFFSHIQVDPLLCWVGKRQPHNVADYYFMSATDMQRFGLTGLHLPKNYTETDLSNFNVTIDYIMLK